MRKITYLILNNQKSSQKNDSNPIYPNFLVLILAKFNLYLLSFALGIFIRRHLKSSELLFSELEAIEETTLKFLPPLKSKKRQWLPISVLELIKVIIR